MMNVHNTNEDIVFATVEKIFNTFAKEGNPDNFCLCNQCRLDTACYVLNRIKPFYIVSSRGVERTELEAFQKQQREADIITLVYEGLRRVNHNQRPNFNHRGGLGGENGRQITPVFNIPTIVGRLFNGTNFAPLSDVKVELYRNGDLVPMKDASWRNPYVLVPNTEGTFTFWPAAVPADAADSRRIFEYSIKIEAPEFETLNHFFKIPVISELQSTSSYSAGRSFKLPDLYMFPPGGEDGQICLV
ncbi:MAG: late competence development ComFB family protein [Treponema sp.]|jgi:competence protein ComFB|nr:late competence development ComFB family protein [Treponema sp.]